MKTKAFIFFSLLICNLLPAQNVKLDIVPHFFGVRADSLFLSMDISVHIKDMDSKSAFILTPVLTSQEKRVSLPHIQLNGKQKQRLTFFLQKSKKLIEHYEYNTQRQCVADMRSFVRFYEFLLQVSSFEDTDLHKKYNFVSYLLAYINIKHPGGGFNLDGKIKATNFVQKKGEEHKSADLVADPVMKLPTAEHFGLTEDKEKRLSEIIDEINSRTGKNYDNDVVVKAMLQIRDILMKSDKLKTSARNNTQQDFEFSYFDDIDDALIEGLSQNQDFFSMLLSNDEMKRQVLGIFSDEIYKSLRNAK